MSDLACASDRVENSPTNARRGPRRLPWWAAIPVAALGGWTFDLANPGLGWWPLAFPALALVIASAWQQRAGVAALAGLAAGAAFWMPHISWLTLYLGPIPWLGLSGAMIAWFVLQGVAIAVATRGAAILLAARPVVLVLAQAVSATGVWVLREGVQGRWPYGGFAWGRVAHVVAESPLAALVSWLGFAGLTALIVLACALVIGGCFAAIHHDMRIAPAPRAALALIVLPPLLLAGLALVPPAALEQTGTLRVAAVQGNSKSGIFDDRESGEVFADHVRATERLLDDLESAGERVDVIVWPENSAEFEITRNPLRGREIALLSERAGAPIVLGSVLTTEDGGYTNSSVVWGARGQQQPRELSRYDKRFPVPFAEYMPNRAFFHALVPDLVDLVQLEYTAGALSPVLPLVTTSREVRAGVAICFDIIFDDQAVRMVGDGAELILAQTNNADFGRTDESVQQLQIARLRAVETGRALVNISTVGTSAIVAPDGAELARLESFTAAAMVAEVPLVAGETPALRFGAVISTAWMVLGGAGLLAGAAALLRARRAAALSKQL